MESCLLRPIRTVRAALSATFESLGNALSRHRALSRASLTALSFTIIVAISQQAAPATQAGPETAPVVPESLLPQTLGIGLATDGAITIPFESSMDAASVESVLQVLPAQSVEASWNEDGTELSLVPDRRWRTDERYLVVIGADARSSDGEHLGAAQRFAFSTETAPAVRDFQVRQAGAPAPADGDSAAEAAALNQDAAAIAESQPPTETAADVSASTEIAVSFSSPMDRPDVEDHFAIQPEVEGDLSWSEGGELLFTPSERLDPGSRYTISLIGSHDADGNALGGKANFSFTIQREAQITLTEPAHEDMNVEAATVEMWFSQPMDTEATNAAFTLTDTNTGQPVPGELTWNEAGTQLVYTPDAAFVAGHTFGVKLSEGARDADGNAVTSDWYFTTTAPPAPVVRSTTTTTTRSAPSTPVIPPPGPATSLAGYALNQVNAARAAYGFAPVVLDASISAVASAHAWDQARNGYFSHYGQNGSTRESRLRAGGVSFGISGENQCYYNGMSEQATLDWCHAQFMAEPYPGHWNHIANILDPRFHRMGVGIASVGGRTVITWNFTD
jgi:uncharacterized protein YkwD